MCNQTYHSLCIEQEYKNIKNVPVHFKFLLLKKSLCILHGQVVVMHTNTYKHF